MAKVSPVSIKYTIAADFESEGLLEKPDVIGALFGQTEGLLGSDLELRELQKEGKIGRIEVELTSEDGKTKGQITIPSALDKTETTIIAAALETIEKIGPTDAKITVKEIEDVRGSKRDYIMERAKQLLSGIKGGEMESQEIGQELRESARTMRIISYGDEALPAGDLSGNEVIVVEGRADVVNMLKHNISNVIPRLYEYKLSRRRLK
jgi:DNA primase